jgi:serine/threonine protein phosphatase PrpC
MVEAGVPEDDARRFRNILTNSLGSNRETVPAEIYHVELQPGDRLLLCTDGLSDMVAAPLVAEALKCQSEPQAACNQLIERALDAGGRDNITVILCDALAAGETS